MKISEVLGEGLIGYSKGFTKRPMKIEDSFIFHIRRDTVLTVQFRLKNEAGEFLGRDTMVLQKDDAFQITSNPSQRIPEVIFLRNDLEMTGLQEAAQIETMTFTTLGAGVSGHHRSFYEDAVCEMHPDDFEVLDEDECEDEDDVEYHS